MSDLNETVCEILELRKAELALALSGAKRKLFVAAHAETCDRLTALIKEHGPKIGLTPDTMARAAEPKHK